MGTKKEMSISLNKKELIFMELELIKRCLYIQKICQDIKEKTKSKLVQLGLGHIKISDNIEF